MSDHFADALAEVVRTLRSTADLIEADAEFPSLTIDPEARDGYRHACLDLADGIERRTIAGGVLGDVEERGPVARDLSEWTRWLELDETPTTRAWARGLFTVARQARNDVRWAMSSSGHVALPQAESALTRIARDLAGLARGQVVDRSGHRRPIHTPTRGAS